MDELLAGRRVLVVEDEMLVMINIEDMLADLGCEDVSSAATVNQALALINSQVFDVAMVDMNLDGNDSYPVADALIAHGVPFIYSTGYSSQNMKEGYRDRPVLRKPYRNAELADGLRLLLRG